MTNRDKVLSTLVTAELCDDCLSVASGVKPRQTVYTACTGLAANGTIHRHHGKCEHCHKAKLVSRLTEEQKSTAETSVTVHPTVAQATGGPPWYWEGNVQARVVSYLAVHGYSIRSVADTASRVAGKDIVAVTPGGDELWVTVKGYPEKSQHVQARHWFSGGIFDLILYRGESPNVKLALALPDGFVTYTNLLSRIAWLNQTMGFQLLWVTEHGAVRVE